MKTAESIEVSRCMNYAVGCTEGGMQVQFPAIVNESSTAPEILGFTLTLMYELVDISPGLKGQNVMFTSLIPCSGGVKNEWSSNSA